MDNENQNQNQTENQIETPASNENPAPEPAAPEPTTGTVKQVDFSKRFKPCRLLVFFAHGHRSHDYKITDREALVQEDGTEVSRWRTEKKVPDPKNAKRAMGLRARFIREAVALGVQYGREKLIFLDFERIPDFEQLKARWAAQLKAFNLESPIVKLDFGFLPPLDLTGPNEYLLGNLVDELKDTLGEMRTALEAADYKSVKDVIKRLKGFTSLVPDSQAVQIQAAIADAKRQARAIKKALVKKGETIEKVQAMVSTATVDVAFAACFEDERGVEADQNVTNQLLEAQAEEFCSALQEDQAPSADSVDPAPEVPVVLDDVPVVDTAPTTPQDPSETLAASPLYGVDFRYDV